jgi:dihydroorotate dehydrogenase (NAD+) catalytic subunit
MAAEADLRVDVGGGLVLANPVIAASGTFGYGVEYAGVADLRALGAVVVKGISQRPCAGHPPPRLVETPAGMLNAIGLQNIGVERFVAEKLPWLRSRGVTVVVNCWGNTVEEYGEVVAALDTAPGIAALEVNISSPNKREWGGIIATDAKRTAEVVAVARGATRLPLWVKLSPNVSDITEVARVAEDAGADALCVANTYIGMAVDLRRRQPILSNVTGGLSGPAIKPLNLRAVYQVVRATKLPVIGIGGISTGNDALEYLLVGAHAVQVGTANLYDPGAGPKILRQIKKFLEAEGVAHVHDFVGSLKSGGHVDRPTKLS